jgi:two-component system, OmpR family, sensor kinase
MLALVAVIALLIAASTVVVVRQRRELIAQVDRQLFDARPLAAIGRPPQPPPPQPPPRLEVPISSLFVAVYADNTIRPVVAGALLESAPRLSSETVDRYSSSPGEAFTADSTDGKGRFRVLIAPIASTTDDLILALPLDGADATTRALVLTLSGTGGALFVVLLLIASWVSRLGLRPMESVTDVARRVSAGERTARVSVNGQQTEAQQLGRAVNEMLDDRDAADTRVRQFVADASHELRTPLTSVRGYLDIWSEGGFTPAQQNDVLRRMRAETRRMNDLVEDLLLLAHLDEGRPLREDTVDLAVMCRDACRDAQAIQPQRPITVDVGDSSLLVRGDDARLRQVIGNLVMNALVHTSPQTFVAITGRRSGNTLSVTVADTGSGISPDLLPHLFDRFSRADASRRRDHGGNGLGLSIAHSIVEAHRGTLTVASSGTGTTFTMTLPAATLIPN